MTVRIAFRDAPNPAAGIFGRARLNSGCGEMTILPKNNGASQRAPMDF